MNEEKRFHGPVPDRRADKFRTRSFSRSYLLWLLILLLGIFLYMIRMFLIPILLAAVFAGLFYGIFDWLQKKLKGKKTLASIITCIIMLLCLMLPLYVIGDRVTREAIGLYQSAEKIIQDVMNPGESTALAYIQNSRIGQKINELNIDLEKSLTEIVKASGSIIAQVINSTSKTTFNFVANLFIIVFTMFYFFRDGKNLIERLKYLSPLQDHYEDELIKRFSSVSRATVKGSLLLGLIQGSIGGIVLASFGISSAILWGLVMVLLSLIPMVGAWLVMYPVGIYQIIVGNVWQGITIILITAILIGNIDNLLRPRLVGKDAGMHDLMIFFSTLGGIAVFGVMGFIIGPILTALLLSVLDIYGYEFQAQLEHRYETVVSAETVENEPTPSEPLAEKAHPKEVEPNESESKET